MKSWRFFDDRATGGAPGSNVTPSVIGQYYMNYGPFGTIYIALLLGVLTGFADRIAIGLRRSEQTGMVVLVGTLYAFIFSSFRFFSPYYIAPFVFGLVMMYVLTRRAPMAAQIPHVGPPGGRR